MSGPYRSNADPSRVATEADLSTWESSRECPDCSAGETRLFAACRQGVVMEACGGCGGVWMDRAIGFALFEEGTGAGVAADLAMLVDRVPTRQTSSHARQCVDCSAPLALRSFHGIILDVCDLHGVWFDRGELRAALAQMTAATFEEHSQLPGAPDEAALEERGRVNAMLREGMYED